MSKVVKASEIDITGALREAISRAIAPVEAWENIANVEAHIEAKVGKWVNGLEVLLDVAVEEQNIELARVLIKDLIGLSKMGKAKAEITLAGVSKLRNETDLSSVDLETLKKATGRE